MSGIKFFKGLLIASIFVLGFALTSTQGKKLDTAPVGLKCRACKRLAETMHEFMNLTESKVGPGGKKWTPQERKRWANSEIRFAELSEKICGGKRLVMLPDDSTCFALFGENEELIEEWWDAPNRDQIELYQFLCLDGMKTCCPKGTFGKKCLACPGLTEAGEVCNGHGTCHGDGTKEGNGKCTCEEQYSGDLCSECKEGFFIEDNSCVNCHESCSACHGATSSDCDKCSSGYFMSEENECKKCTSPCETCDLKGCLTCAEGYEMNEAEEGRCVDIDECALGNMKCGINMECFNTRGSAECKCKRGYKFHKKDICVRDPDFEDIDWDEEEIVIEAGQKRGEL